MNNFPHKLSESIENMQFFQKKKNSLIDVFTKYRSSIALVQQKHTTSTVMNKTKSFHAAQ